MDPIFWTNVQVHAQTELATAITLSSISKAAEGVVTSAGHGLTTGDILVISASGMVEVNDRVFRVTVATVDTFTLDDEDTTDYNTFTSGTARKVTFGVGATTLQDVQVSGGEPNFADTSTIHEQTQRRVPTTTSPITMSFTSLFDGSDPFLAEMRKAAKKLSKRAIKLTFSNGSVMVGNAYVSASGAPTGSAGQPVQTPMSLEMQGAPNTYAAAA